MLNKNNMVVDEATLAKIAEFHGHYCPGMALGVLAASIAIDDLGRHVDGSNELVGRAETDMCAADAVQMMTGCTFGKGNLLHLDHGKNAFTFTRQRDGRTIRVAIKPDGWPRNPEHVELMAKTSAGTASPEEQARFKELHVSETYRVVSFDPRSVFDVEVLDEPISRKPRGRQSALCASCGETTQEGRLVDSDKGKVCLACGE